MEAFFISWDFDCKFLSKICIDRVIGGRRFGRGRTIVGVMLNDVSVGDGMQSDNDVRRK